MTSTTSNTNQGFESSGLSPKLIILQIRSAWRFLLSKWLIIFGIAIVAGAIGAIIASYKKTTIKAEVTFAVDEGNNRQDHSTFSLFSEQLGLAPIDGGIVFTNAGNIVELLKSRLLIEKTLRSFTEINKKKILFADFFLDSLDFRPQWVGNNQSTKLNFTSGKKTDRELLFENGVIANMYKLLVSKMILVAQKSKGTSIVSVSCTTENELFSKYFLEALINEVIRFYIDSKTARARQNLTIIEKRTDSVKNAYVGAAYGRAQFADADINLVRESFSVPGEKKQTDVQILRAAYIDLSRNLESAKTSLMNETPQIQIIDTPILPLDRIRPSLWKQFILFSIIGFFITVFVLLLNRAYQYLVYEEETGIDEYASEEIVQ
ncbi:MAG: hypothetical protein ACKVOW_21080 [Chitinophagaceae bacterium]